MVSPISLQERLQLKREPLDKWSVREKLCLGTAVVRSGDQNWMSVSRALKPFGEPNRPTDWFHQKNCAAQYGALLENVETPKRKKRVLGADSVLETPSESILRNLFSDRQAELRQLLLEEKKEYLKLQEDMKILQSGNVTEEQLDKWCKEMDEEETRKDMENASHALWLNVREQRKQELERAWRPILKPVIITPGIIKTKANDGLDEQTTAQEDGRKTPATNTPEISTKPALSPLLTSLLKSPSQQHQSVVTSSILHSAITSQRTTTATTNPTIASLLNSSASVTVSPGIQQLVTTAISQEPIIVSQTTMPIIQSQIPQSVSDMLVDSDNVPNLKEIEKTISIDPLPEMKNEEVDVIISDLIDNADIVSDPEEHLLDVNDDIINSLESELEELVNEENAAIAVKAELEKNKVLAEEKNKVLAEERNKALVEERNKALAEERNKILVEQRNKALVEEKNKALIEEKKLVDSQILLQKELLQVAEDIKEQKEENIVEKIIEESKDGEMMDVPVEIMIEKEDCETIKDGDLEQLKEKSKELPEIDPFEFQEDPEIFQPSKLSSVLKQQQDLKSIDLPQKETQKCLDILSKEESIKDNVEFSKDDDSKVDGGDDKVDKDEINVSEMPDKVKKSGSVEIVEVVVMEDENLESEQLEEPVKEKEYATLPETVEKSLEIVEEQNLEENTEEITSKIAPASLITKTELEEDEESSNSNSKDTKPVLDVELAIVKQEEIEIKEELIEVEESEVAGRSNTFTPDYSGEMSDDLSIEVTKVGKVKRDYSRTKKKDDSELDLLFVAGSEQLIEDELIDPKIKDFKDLKSKLKGDTDDSNNSSPWTEEDETLSNIRIRRYSTPIDSIPNSPASSFDDDSQHRDYRNWKKAVMMVYSRLNSHKYASLFQKSITNEQAPNYHDMVYKPMDLVTIRRNIDGGVTRSNWEFQRDVLLMFSNAIMYNRVGGEVYRMAEEMRGEAREQLEMLFAAQSGGSDSLVGRRETRESRNSESGGGKRKRSSVGGEDGVGRVKKKKED